MVWAKPLYGKGKIDWAGELISKDKLSFSNDSLASVEAFWKDFDAAVSIVNNWRSVHSYPLQAIKMTLKGRAKSICPDAIVAQRLKRYASIRFKLNLSKKLGNHPKLSQMQDIGGCRAVLETVSQVRELEEKFAEASKRNPYRGPQYFKKTDYISSPKDNGYRGVHLIYKFRTDSTQHSCYNGQRIEIQLRSKRQHYWATAVETYSTFTGEALKSNVGSDQWKRFFAVASSVIALDEECPTVPSTSSEIEILLPELKSLYISLNAHTVLTEWAATAKYTAEEAGENIRDAAMYLLVLNPEDFSTTIYPYQANQITEANNHYAKIEQEQANLQAVLVAVDSVAALRAAYPNYYLDTSSFLQLIQKATHRI